MTNVVVTILIALVCIGMMFILAFAINARSIDFWDNKPMKHPFDDDDPLDEDPLDNEDIYTQHDQRD